MEALEVLKIIVGIMLAFLPGFGLTLAIFPEPIDDRYPKLYRFFISLGVAVVILILVGSLLGVLQIFRLFWIIVSLASLSAVFFGAWYLRLKT